MKKKLFIPLLLIVLLLVGASFYLVSIRSILKKQQQVIQLQSTALMHSNQWYSNIYKDFPTQPLYALPLVYKLSENGLGISYPDIHKTPETIYASYDNDLTVGFDTPFSKPRITTIGDWSIGLSMSTQNNKQMRFSLVKGSPSVIVHTGEEPVSITLPQDFQVFTNNKEKQLVGANPETDNFLLRIKNHNYIIVLGNKTKITLSDRTIIMLNPGKISIAILDTPEHYALFRKAATTEITDTNSVWKIQGNHLVTTYTFSANARPLITLFPNHADTLQTKQQILGSYETLRGKLELVQINAFTTVIPLLVPPLTYAPLTSNHADFINAVRADTKEFLSGKQPDSHDYFLGTWFGKGANLLMLADSSKLSKEKQDLIAFLEPKLVVSLQGFTYNDKKKSLLASQPEFGNENLNDHHFHYGYYIRTAAVLSALDPTFFPKVNDTITLMVDDIATSTRDSSQFPYLRNFDIYESHSWADGFGDFADGNNQESSSEAIHAWYSVYLWGKVTGNTSLQNTGLYLYNSEVVGTEYYWFGKNKVYSSPYNHDLASIVWGGKIDFATWFSSNTNMKYGIQLLPFTPGSIYLKQVTDFVKYKSDFEKSGGNVKSDWGDLFIMWQSFSEPSAAFALKDTKVMHEANTPDSLFRYYLYRNFEQN